MTPRTGASEQADELNRLNDMQRYLVHEFVEDYQDGLMSRRDLLARVGHIAGGTAAGLALLAALGVSASEAWAQDATSSPPASGAKSPISVAPDDPAVSATQVTFPSGDADVMAYEARPAGEASPVAAAGAALVLVCHENRGLTEHIQDVARRLAKSGYVACAVDLLSREGGTAAIADASSIPGLLTDGDPNRHVEDFRAAIAFYGTQSGVDATKVGMVGFCFGGGITWRSATLIPELNAAVPFYGPPPPLDQVPNINAAVLGVYSDDPDDFANEERDALQQALDAAGVTYEFKVYPGTQHAFNNDTGQRYNEEQALAAWSDTLDWFGQHIGA